MEDSTKDPASMIPLLTGALLGLLLREGDSIFKIRCMNADPPDGFRVEFASGLVLRVRVEEEKANG
jgi:hypothetical protein